jgi:exopolysaccharide biosynthesis polyprenyl glycosylphosphotransferase
MAWSVVAFIAGERLELGGAGVVALWGATAGLLVLLRSVARTLAQAAAPPERALVVGPAKARERLAHCLACDPSAHVEVVGFLPFEDEHHGDEDWGERSGRQRQLCFDDLEQVASELEVSRVFLLASGSDTEQMLEAVRRTTQTGVKVSIVPSLFEVVGSAVEFDVVGGVTVLGVRPPRLGRSSRLIKRSMDLAGAAIGLLVLAPFGLLVATLIKLDTPGPVFFRQPRIGKDGETFQMLKFRTMVDGAHAQREALAHLNETHGLFKIANDPRVTRVGRLLRRTSLDELPQLINVLRGEMSLVGPRPLIPDEDALSEGRHRDRQNLTPGITGMWQVLGPARPPLAEMAKADYLYATNWSIWNDTKILLRTLMHVAARRGR